MNGCSLVITGVKYNYDGYARRPSRPSSNLTNTTA